MAFQFDTAPILGSPKSTINGLLSAAIAVIVAVLAIPPGARKVVYVLATLRALNGLFQQDAGSVLARVPGSAEPQAVPSHESPDDAAAVPVAGVN